MLTSILILAFSLILFIYWFRYTCLLMLHSNAGARESDRTVASGDVNFPSLQTRLDAANPVPLDSLCRSLEHDYRVLCYLLDHAAGLGLPSMERFLLSCDYHIMQVWYRLTRNSSARSARYALNEMSAILTYLSNRMTRQSI